MVIRRSPWTLEDLLSSTRLHPYLVAAGNLDEAMLLYDWNNQVSAAFYESLHYLEVGLRNAFDQTLTRWVDDQGATGSWYTVIDASLNPGARVDTSASERPTTEGSPRAMARSWPS